MIVGGTGNIMGGTGGDMGGNNAGEGGVVGGSGIAGSICGTSSGSSRANTIRITNGAPGECDTHNIVGVGEYDCGDCHGI